MSRLMTKPTKSLCTQRRLRIRPVWSESSLCTQWVAKDQAFLTRTAKTLIRLGGCPGWSESSLGVHDILWVLSWCSLFQHYMQHSVNISWGTWYSVHVMCSISEGFSRRMYRISQIDRVLVCFPLAIAFQKSKFCIIFKMFFMYFKVNPWGELVHPSGSESHWVRPNVYLSTRHSGTLLLLVVEN